MERLNLVKMGEIFLLTRGHADHVEKWERSMRSQFFPLKYKKKVKDEMGREMEIETQDLIDAQLRPIQLWGYVVPDEYIQPICNNLGIPTDEKFFDVKPKEGEGTGTSFMSGFGVKGVLEALRLGLGAKKLPERDPNKGVWAIPIYRNFVNVLGIGYREDGKIKTVLGEHDRI